MLYYIIHTRRGPPRWGAPPEAPWTSRRVIKCLFERNDNKQDTRFKQCKHTKKEKTKTDIKEKKKKTKENEISNIIIDEHMTATDFHTGYPSLLSRRFVF